MKPNQIDPYKVLGVDVDATDEEIKKEYRKKAMENHPDRPGGDADKFAAIAIAYDILSDKKKRSAYDRLGEYKSEMQLHREIADTVAKSFLTHLTQCGNEIFARNLFGMMREQMRQSIVHANKTFISEKRQKEDEIVFLEQVKKSIKRKAGSVPLFEAVLEDQIKDLLRDIAKAESKCNDDVKVFEGCIDFLKDYTFDPERPDSYTLAVRGRNAWRISP